ncbi:unnamed protein product [Bursaphelenchus xylophilus]|nr:unnamed protein product [Bursaphelenchus xylophilus]CAG9092479.1 unnamed protein product [Bursaphelenchus xylophilus]
MGGSESKPERNRFPMVPHRPILRKPLNRSKNNKKKSKKSPKNLSKEDRLPHKTTTPPSGTAVENTPTPEVRDPRPEPIPSSSETNTTPVLGITQSEEIASVPKKPLSKKSTEEDDYILAAEKKKRFQKREKLTADEPTNFVKVQGGQRPAVSKQKEKALKKKKRKGPVCDDANLVTANTTADEDAVTNDTTGVTDTVDTTGDALLFSAHDGLDSVKTAREKEEK